MENRKSIDLDLERRDFEASGICTESMFENVMWDQWQFKYVPLVREKKICDNAIKINDRFLGWNAAKATPEGFVLVPNDTIMSIYDTCDKALDSDIAYRSALLNIKNDVAQYADSIEAQEQSHDNSN